MKGWWSEIVRQGQPAVFEDSPRLLFIMRLCFSLLLLSAIPWGSELFKEQPHPLGLAQWIDFTFLSRPAVARAAFFLSALGLAAYTAGKWPRVALTPAALCGVGFGTLAMSQGAQNHNTQLLVLCLLAQWIVHLVRGGGVAAGRQAVYWTNVVIASGYVVCGVVKLVRSNGIWIWKAPLLTAQLLKTNWSAYYDDLTPLPAWLEPMTRLFLEHPSLARVFFGSGLVLELAAILALLSRRWALVVGLALIALHLSISVVMNLNFTTHMWILAIFWVLPGLSGLLGRARLSDSAAPCKITPPGA